VAEYGDKTQPTVQTRADAQVAARFQSAVNYPRWKDEIATPAVQQYPHDKTSLNALAAKLQSGWGQRQPLSAR
jgi:hypothetical protein